MSVAERYIFSSALTPTWKCSRQPPRPWSSPVVWPPLVVNLPYSALTGAQKRTSAALSLPPGKHTLSSFLCSHCAVGIMCHRAKVYMRFCASICIQTGSDILYSCGKILGAPYNMMHYNKKTTLTSLSDKVSNHSGLFFAQQRLFLCWQMFMAFTS